jgi:hypothetical protein
MSFGTNTPSRPVMPAGWHSALASNTGRSAMMPTAFF